MIIHYNCSYCGGWDEHKPDPDPNVSSFTAIASSFSAFRFNLDGVQRDICNRCAIKGLDILLGPGMTINEKRAAFGLEPIPSEVAKPKPVEHKNRRRRIETQ